MRLTPLLLACLFCLGTAASGATHHATKKSPAARHTAAHGATKRATAGSRGSARGKGRLRAAAKPVAHTAPMDAERATAIQTALIKNGYLTGEPSGKWDAASISAMQKLQSDNGWQSKVVPDARGLIKLGLGPQPAAATPPPQP